MIKGKIDLGLFKTFINAINTIAPDCQMEISSDGLKTAVTDSANAAMVKLYLGIDAFEEFTGDQGIIAVDIAKMAEALRMMKGDVVSLEKQDDSPYFRIEGDNYQYQMTLLDPSVVKKMPQVPDFSYEVSVEVEGQKFNEVVRAVGTISDKVSFVAGESGFKMEAAGDVENFVADVCDGPLPSVKSMYSIDYLSDFSKVLKSSEAIFISFGSDYPLSLTFEMEGGKGTYILAPRIESH